MTEDERRGTIAGVLCYCLWGSLPLYWKLLADVSSFEVVGHRVVWCFAVTMAACALLHLQFRLLLHQKRALVHLVPAALLITANWTIYIVAVNSGHVVEAALGYYINPLMTILLGRVVFRERLSRLQAIAVALCTVGVVWFTVDYGRFPWFALSLALTFAAYGAIKKHGGYPAIPALAVENLVMAPVALVFLVVLACVTGSHGFLGDVSTGHGWLITLLLVGAGPVTAVPLILFATAANKIPLTLLGFIQYVSPTISLILGVFVFGEAFTSAHAVCFGLIWCGLALVVWDSIMRARG